MTYDPTNSLCLFGDVVDGEMILNDAGSMIETWWKELENKFPSLKLDSFRVMPNHFHGILSIMGTGMDMVANFAIGVDDLDLGSAEENEGIVTMKNRIQGGHTGPPLRTRTVLGDAIQWFKTMTTNEYMRCVKELGWIRLEGRLWQQDYFDHIVRNADSLNRIRDYIRDNPIRWFLDRENPNRNGSDEFDEWLLDSDRNEL